MADSKGKKESEDTIKALLEVVEERFEQGIASEADVLQVKRVLSRTTLEQELFEQRAAGALPAAQLKAEVTSLDTIELVRTSLVRFGGVAVILFLISLLTPIYRYNVRLGTFYQARADTLLLSRDPEMIRLLTPTYGFRCPSLMRQVSARRMQKRALVVQLNRRRHERLVA